MAQLIVRQFDDSLVKTLKMRAQEHHVSMEEEHRQIWRDALKPKGKKASFKKALQAMPDFGSDAIFERIPQSSREIDL